MQQTAFVQMTPEMEDMIGTWGTEEGPALIIKNHGDQLEICGAPNDTWRTEISDARVVGNSVFFIEKNYLHNGESHPFNGHRCDCVIEMEDVYLTFKITNTEDPSLPPGYLMKLD